MEDARASRKRLNALLDAVLDHREAKEQQRVAKIIRQRSRNPAPPARSEAARRPRRQRGSR